MKSFTTFLQEGRIERKKLSVGQITEWLKDKTFVIFDTETTGLFPKLKFVQITELAAIAVKDGKEIGRYVKKIKLGKNVEEKLEKEKKIDLAQEWDPEKTYVYGDYVKYKGKLYKCKQNHSKGKEPYDRPIKKDGKIQTRDWKLWDYKSIKSILDMNFYFDEGSIYEEMVDVLDGFHTFLKNYKPEETILVAHNAKFDMYQMNSILEKSGKEKIKGYKVLDTMTLSKNYLIPIVEKMSRAKEEVGIKAAASLADEKGKLRNKLASLAKMFDVSSEKHHEAITDVQMLSQILVKIIEFLNKYKSYLGEMPYITYGNDKVFDLELEKYSTNPQEFLDLLSEILKGRAFTDKYGSKISLQNEIEKESFVLNMWRDIQFDMWIKDKNIKNKVKQIIYDNTDDSFRDYL